MLVRLAQVLEEGGESRSAWRERVRALALLDQIRHPRQRHAQLNMVVLACLQQGLTRTALHAAEALVESARRGSSPAYLIDGLLWRSLILSGLSIDEQAGADLAEARHLIPQVRDAGFAEALAAQADAVEGRIFAAREPARAAAALTRALSYYERETPVWVPEPAPGSRARPGGPWPRRRGRSAADRGHPPARVTAPAAPGRPAAGFLLRPGRVPVRRDGGLPDRQAARPVSARCRSSSAVVRGSCSTPFTLRGQRRGQTPGLSSRTEPQPREPRELQRKLPAGIALVYYECLPDRLLSWVVTREDIHFGEQALDKDDLRQEVAAHQAAMEGRAALSVVRQQTASLYDRLIRPLSSHLRGQRALVLRPGRDPAAGGVRKPLGQGGRPLPDRGPSDRRRPERVRLHPRHGGHVSPFAERQAAIARGRQSSNRSRALGRPAQSPRSRIRSEGGGPAL